MSINIFAKKSLSFEDIRNACVYLPFDHFMFKFDLKSGYHRIDILQEHQTFLAFSWPVNGVRKFFVFFYYGCSCSCQILEELCCENNSLP